MGAADPQARPHRPELQRLSEPGAPRAFEHEGHHWLPFTQMRRADRLARRFARGCGTRLIDSDGHEVFDAISSVWTTIHGHCHPAIVDAIARQAATLDHATALGATNPVAEELAARLCALCGHDRAIFGGDGASAIEAALKIALQYRRNIGQPERTRFARLVDGYHGDTIGAMSVSDVGLFKAPFSEVCFESIGYDGLDAGMLARPDLAAVIVEPVVQAAAGMRIVEPARYAALERMRASLPPDARPLVIVDEIATGFGRTARMFASQGVLGSDLMVVGKGLTGGTLALSATLATTAVYDAFLGEHAEGRHFFHGHSFCANPIACAAALASLDLFERERTLSHVAELSDALATALEPLAAHPAVRAIRREGLMCGIAIDQAPYAGEPGPTGAWNVAHALYRAGHFTRPIGDVIQLVPPLSSSPEELRAFCAALENALDRATVRGA